MTIIRRLRTPDLDAVDAVHRAAFADGAPVDTQGPVHVALNRALHEPPWLVPALSLVAAEPDGAIVGHAISSRGTLGGAPSLGLGPIGVLPSHQRRGIGKALMHASLAAAEALEEPVVCLLGDPGYYGRFGFVAAADVAIDAPNPEWGPFFQARRLGDGPWPTGAFAYASPFDDVE